MQAFETPIDYDAIIRDAKAQRDAAMARALLNLPGAVARLVRRLKPAARPLLG